MRLAPTLLLGLLCLVPGGARAADQTIGSWLLVCPAEAGGCALRHKNAYLRAGSLQFAMEVRSVGGLLVPVVALHGVSAEVAMMGSLAIGLRFDHGGWTEMDCPEWSVCTPRAASLAATAAALPGALSVTLRIELTVPRVAALPQPELTFDLAGTEPALRRLRRAGATEEAMPAEPGLDLRRLMNKIFGGR